MTEKKLFSLVNALNHRALSVKSELIFTHLIRRQCKLKGKIAKYVDDYFKHLRTFSLDSRYVGDEVAFIEDFLCGFYMEDLLENLGIWFFEYSNIAAHNCRNEFPESIRDTVTFLDPNDAEDFDNEYPYVYAIHSVYFPVLYFLAGLRQFQDKAETLIGYHLLGLETFVSANWDAYSYTPIHSRLSEYQGIYELYRLDGQDAMILFNNTEGYRYEGKDMIPLYVFLFIKEFTHRLILDALKTLHGNHKRILSAYCKDIHKYYKKLQSNHNL